MLVMVDYTTILTTLWQKVRNPIPNLLIGLVFLQFAPVENQWYGYIFLAVGASRPLEALSDFFLKFIERRRRDYGIAKTLESLNAEEKNLLKDMLERNEQTIAIIYQDYHRPMAKAPKGGRTEYVTLFSTCVGLHTKKILVSGSVSEATTFTIYPEVWVVMNNAYKKKPQLFENIRR